MAGAENKRSLGKIADLLEVLKQREIPVVHERATVSEIVDAFVRSHHSRVLYVVDNEGRLRGVISLGNYVRHVFFLYHGPQIDTRSLISMVVSETAEHFMQREAFVHGGFRGHRRRARAHDQEERQGDPYPGR